MRVYQRLAMEVERKKNNEGIHLEKICLRFYRAPLFLSLSLPLSSSVSVSGSGRCSQLLLHLHVSLCC